MVNQSIMEMRSFFSSSPPTNTEKQATVKKNKHGFFPIRYLKNGIQRGLDSYHARFIETSSVEPLYHICFGGMAFSYLVALPEELRHLEHQKQKTAAATTEQTAVSA